MKTSHYSSGGSLKVKAALLAAAMVAASMLLSPPAQAAVGTPLSEADLAFVTESSERLGIAPPVRDRLIANLEKGIVPQSMTGAAPISSKTKNQPDKMVIRKEFEDGSVSLTTFQNATEHRTGRPKDYVTPMSVSNCVDYSGVGTWEFRSCDVRTDQFAFTMAFESDGRRGSSCSPTFAAKIYNIYGAWYTGVGSASTITQQVLQGTQSCSGPARARASTSVNMGWYSTTASLTFYAQNGSRWDTSP
ncbi:hypothetical protein V3C33_08405 [Micrococcaceae bacterium Sec5.7]